MTIKNITVIGSGTMGNGIAHVCAQFGYEVSLVDISQTALDKALQTITKNLDRQIQKGTLSEDEKNQTLQRLKTFTVLKDAVINADLVIEAASENFNIKEKITKKNYKENLLIKFANKTYQYALFL